MAFVTGYGRGIGKTPMNALQRAPGNSWAAFGSAVANRYHGVKFTFKVIADMIGAMACDINVHALASLRFANRMDA